MSSESPYLRFGEAAVHAGEAGVTQEEFQHYMGAAHYLFKDDDVHKILKRHPRLEKLLIGISHMIRTSNLSKRVRDELKIRWRIAVRLELLVLNRGQEEEEEEQLSVTNSVVEEFMEDEEAVEVLKKHPEMVRLLMSGANREQELGSVATYNLLVMYGYAAIDDTDTGWRGRLVTERIKTIKIEGVVPKRKKILGIF